MFTCTRTAELILSVESQSLIGVFHSSYNRFKVAFILLLHQSRCFKLWLVTSDASLDCQTLAGNVIDCCNCAVFMAEQQ